MMAGTSSRGLKYEYQAETPTSGVLTLRYDAINVPACAFNAAAGSLEVVFDMCGVKGVVEDPEISTQAPRNSARLRVHWTRRR